MEYNTGASRITIQACLLAPYPARRIYAKASVPLSHPLSPAKLKLKF